MRRRGVIGLLATAGLLASCDGLLQHASFRARMTVEAATPLGLRTGSSVMEFDASSEIPIGTQSNARYSAGLSKGEAVVVDRPDGPLFILLKLPDAAGGLGGAIFEALNNSEKPLSNDDMMAFVKKMGAAGASYRGEVRRDRWPLIVRFRDIADPKSVERVDPDSVGITGIIVETTSDPVTTGIEKRLPAMFWRVWGSIDKTEMGINGGPMKNPYFQTLAGNLSRNDFTTERAQ